LLIGVVLGCGAGFILSSIIGLGRQDELMHALVMLLKSPEDENIREYARQVLRG
jgi:uncharacterized membrane protein